MYPNQPQVPQNPTPPPPQGATPPQPYQQAGQPSFQQPVPQQPVQPAQPTYQPQPQMTQPQPSAQPYAMPPQQSYPPQQSETWGQTNQQNYTAEQPQLTPDGMASIDYLNHISSKSTGGMGFSRKQIFLFGGLLILAVGVLLAYIVSSNLHIGPNLTESAQTLVSQAGTLGEVAEESQKNIKGQSLSNANSALRLQLSSGKTSLTESFGAAGISVEKPSKKVVAATSNDELLKILVDAQLEGRFDRIYITEMTHQLENMLDLIESIRNRTSNEDLSSQLEQMYNNITPLYESIKDTDTSTS